MATRPIKVYNGSEWDDIALQQTDAQMPAAGGDGQVLAKASATSYDVEWVDPPTGGASVASIFLLMGA